MEKFENKNRILNPAEQAKLLVDVRHIQHSWTPEQGYDPEVLAGIEENLETKVQEDAMSTAVTRSFQPMAEVHAENGERRRTFIWRGLGRTAMQVAESGTEFHESPAALARVPFEIREAQHSEDNLRPGTAQSFISLKMTEADASYDVAKAEHLADEDAVRTTVAVTNADGEVIGRQIQSLLVRDIPIEAWVAMLRDPSNPYGRAFDIENPDSALSIMALFDQFDTNGANLPEGPVTLVAAAVKYIQDDAARQSVEEQLEGFRNDQEKLRQEAKQTATKWMKFEVAMAESLRTKIMQHDVKMFVEQLQCVWPEEILALLKQHEDGHEYEMSDELAAVLEQGWEKVNLGEVAISVGDKRATSDMDKAKLQQLQTNSQFIRVLEQSGDYSAREIDAMRSQHNREVAMSGVRPGGGCAGENGFKFGTSGSSENGQNTTGATAEANTSTPDAVSGSTEKLGKIKLGVCRFGDVCPSGTDLTWVGGCDICLDHCQVLFDANLDPDDIFQKAPKPPPVEKTPKRGILAMAGMGVE